MKKYKPTEIREVYPIDTPLCTKMMYESETEARAAILHLKEVAGIKNLSCYACMKCGYYHLTRNFE
jgi:hypothetical protein